MIIPCLKQQNKLNTNVIAITDAKLDLARSIKVDVSGVDSKKLNTKCNWLWPTCTKRIIQIRKLLFIRSIMVMHDDELPKKIFCDRAKCYFSNEHYGNENPHQSAVFDLLNVCAIFGLLNEVKSMVERHRLFPKTIWKRMVWEKGWQLENLHWRIEKHLYRHLDILNGVCPVTRYLTWWMILDRFPMYTKDCEILSKIFAMPVFYVGMTLSIRAILVPHKCVSYVTNLKWRMLGTLSLDVLISRVKGLLCWMKSIA